ncbi:MAG: hypothetical protein QNJ58_07750 [Desulfobacterales bacterium]|nr:hypothetical protein [Desulfobacterales bacterium]
MKIRLIFIIVTMLVCVIANKAHSYEKINFTGYTRNQFRDYWYSLGAEISRFSLEQVRYGEIHKGDAVLVFVTEEFNPAIQIKADKSRPDNVPVLKLNFVRKFFTGIYPYSILTSVFSPVDVRNYPLPMKISSSTQEWCGHAYTQLNLNDDRYRVRMHSYFEKEGDQDFRLKSYVPEDAIWNMIRIAPDTLPLREFLLIPGTVYARLAHRQLAPRKAVATLKKIAGKSLENNPLVLYEIDIPAEQRTLRIVFEEKFPYRIQKWEESYRSMAAMGGKLMTTRAVRSHTILDPYWQHHRNQDRVMLKKLGLNAREMGKE